MMSTEQITNEQVFPNMAEDDRADTFCHAELEAAGIGIEKLGWIADGSEVPTHIIGSLYGWVFKRAWCYWVAKGPGIPPEYARRLHETHGKVVRVDGLDISSDERNHGFATGYYHVDTPSGLKALADMLRLVVSDFEKTVSDKGEK